jgi:hypothetical protein
MTIEFECTTCDKPLRVPQEMAGGKAKCQRCGTILTVPEAAQFLWPPGAGPPSESRPTAPATDVGAPFAPRAAPVQPPPLNASAASKSGIMQNAVAAPVAAPVEPSAAASLSGIGRDIAPIARPLAVQPSQHATQSPTAAVAPRASPAAPQAVGEPLIEDFDSLFDPDELTPGKTGHAAVDRVPGNAAGIGIGHVMRSTWRIYTVNVWLCLAAFIVWAIVMGAAVAGALLARFALSGFAAGDEGSALIVAGIVDLVSFAICVWLQVGYLTFTLNVARGEPAGISNLFGAGFVWLQALVISALEAGLVAAGGFAAIASGSPLPLVPAVVLALIIEPSKLVLVDQRRGIVDAVQQAAWLALQNILPLAALFPIAVVSLVAGCTATLGVGSAFLVPFFTLMYAVIYLRMIEQRTADEVAGF